MTVTYAVPQPVGSGRESDTTGADRQRVDFTHNDPSTGTPCGREEEDVDANECDFSLDGGRVGSVHRSGDGDDEFAHHHAQRSPDQQRTTPKSLNGVEGDGRGAHIDQGGDEADEERVADRAELLEEGRTEVEDEVDTGPLLHHLERCTKDGAAQIALLYPEGALEAIGPGGEVVALRNHLQFVFMVGDNFGQFRLHELRIARLATQTTEHVGSTINLASLDEVAGRFREEEETDGQDEGPKHLQRDRDPVGTAVSVVLRAVVNARGEEDANGDAKLVTRHNGTAHLFGGDFGHVEDDDGRDKADTETGDETTSHEESIRG